MGIVSKLRLRRLGPVASVPLREALRAGSGALLALAGAGLIALTAWADALGFAVLAPFGASAVLLFAAVNSPLAQPWPVVVGNTASALVAIGICSLTVAPLLAIPLSVGGAILAMALLRATHPPGGAVALTVALAAGQGAVPGLGFALVPVAAGSVFLVLVAMVWARMTGRRYPMRQFGAPGPVLTADPPAIERLGLSEADLRGILADYRQSLNLGVEDLARLIGAAELRSAGHQAGPRTAGDIMSRDLVTVGPGAALAAVAEIFCRHGFTSLPVVLPDGTLRGVIFQLDLVAALSEVQRGRLLRWRLQAGKTAAEIMTVVEATVDEETPIGVLVSRLSEGGADAVMVLNQERLVGVVTQTDLIAALAREIFHNTASGTP